MLWGGSILQHSHLPKPQMAQTVLWMIPGNTENCIFSLREVKGRNTERGREEIPCCYLIPAQRGMIL